MAKVKKAQKGGCLSTTGSSTRTSLYKSAAGEGGSGSDRRAARQFARNERRMDKAAAKMEREEAKAAPKGKSGLKVKKIKKAQTGAKVASEMTPGKKVSKASQDARTDKMAKALDKASVLGSKFKKPVAKKKNGGTVSMQLGSYDRQLGKNYSGKAKMGKSVGKCKYGC